VLKDLTEPLVVKAQQELLEALAVQVLKAQPAQAQQSTPQQLTLAHFIRCLLLLLDQIKPQV
jgi:hypothetical protein